MGGAALDTAIPVKGAVGGPLTGGTTLPGVKSLVSPILGLYGLIPVGNLSGVVVVTVMPEITEEDGSAVNVEVCG